MSRNTWLTIALVLGAAVIWWAVLWEPAAPAEEPAAATPVTEQPASAPTAAPSPRSEAPAAPPEIAPSADAPAPTSPTQQAAPTSPTAPATEQQIPVPERTGPVEELAAKFASEPRDSNATEPETLIQAAFRRPEVPNGLLKSVLCRASVCKIETRWTPARAAGFMGAFMSLVASPDGAPIRKFDPDIAILPETTSDANGERAIDVYLKRID